MTRLSLGLLAAGAFVLCTSVGWWWLTYSDVIGYDYISIREAGRCLTGDSDICRLARSLCRTSHPLALLDYSASAFWIGLVALSSGFCTFDRRPG